MKEITTFEHDLLGLKPFGERLWKFIKTEGQFVTGGLVIGLSAKFGSGKTTFLKMWKSYLEEQRDEEDVYPLVINISAWESDYYDDPLFALISALADHLEPESEKRKKLVEAAKDVGWFGIALGGQAIRAATGLDFVAAGDISEKKKSARKAAEKAEPDAFSQHVARRDAMNKLKETIKEVVSPPNPKAIFLIDEMDRCRPDYAISFLETIKHIFDATGAVFILAADRDQLECSAKTAFGIGLDFEEYYRKFIHREVQLPKISDNNYGKLVENYVADYLQLDGIRECFLELNRYRIKDITVMITALHLTPRQIQEMFRLLGHILTSDKATKGRLYWCLGVGSIMMTILKVGRPGVFEMIGKGQFSASDALEFFSSILPEDENNRIEYWFQLCLTGGGIKKKSGESNDEVSRQAGVADKFSSDWGRWMEGWGGPTSRPNRLREIYNHIQEVHQFI